MKRLHQLFSHAGGTRFARITNEALRPMKTGARIMNRRLLFGSLLALLILFGGAATIQPAAAIDHNSIINALRSTVQVIAPDNNYKMFSLGSGTVMDAGGLILTNRHVVAGDAANGLMNDSGLVGIAVTPPDLKGDSVLKYYGKVVKTDKDLDLALIQVVAMADDPKAPLPANLGLPPVARGDSDKLIMGDEINIFGFPGVGGNSATYTKGAVSGFLDENHDGVYEWIKTDAELNHGNSGGLATDDQGKFVGVPSAGSTDSAGKIGLVRTGNLALKFVQSYFPPAQTDGPQVSSVQFAQAIDRKGQPLNPAVKFDSGISDLYAIFDYSGLENGKTLTYVWYADGFESTRDSFPWDGGASGNSWVSLYNDKGIKDGFVELELIYDGKSLYRGGVVVGNATPPQSNGNNSQNTGSSTSTFGPITFAEDVSNEQPVRPGTTFSNLKAVYGIFDYSGMSNGAQWSMRWYLNGQSVLEKKYVWDASASGTYNVSLSHPDGLPAGDYKLELYIADQLAQSGTFSISGSTPQPSSKDVTVIGTVTDQDNSRNKISGALIVFLNPGVKISDWANANFPKEQIHAAGTSNASGAFQLDAKVTPGQKYGVVVVNDNYKAVTVDDYQIPPDANDPYDLEVTMQHK